MKNLIRIILTILISGFVCAQQRISADELIEIAVSENFQNSINDARIKKAELDRKGVVEFPKTGLFVENEDFSPNEPNGVWKVGLEQEIPWPGLNKARKNYMDQLISVQQMNREAVKAEIIRDIKKSYYELWYLEQKKNLYLRLDSMYSNQFQAANIRYNTGDVPGLDRISAEAKLNENIALKLQIEKEIEILQKRLMLLTNRQELYLPEKGQLPKLEISGLESVGAHPSLLVQQQEIEVSRSLIEVQKQQNHPDFSFRAFSQVYLGEKDPISGFSFGMSFPLFGLRPMKNRNEAIRQEVELKETELNWQKMNLSSMQQQSLTEVDKQKIMIDFYESSGLKDADAIISAATLSYRSGEISFAEMNTFVIQAISIKDKYLESLNLYNQSVIEYNYLINQN